MTPEQLKIIFVLARRAGIADEVMKERIYQQFGVASSLIEQLRQETELVQAAG